MKDTAHTAQTTDNGKGAVLCYCFNVTREQVVHHFATPGATLEQFIDETQITRKCTACALDLDVLLDSLHASRMGQVQADRITEKRGGIRTAFDRVDSGFFVEDGSISSQLVLANYPPLDGSDSLCAKHRWTLLVFDESGRKAGMKTGEIGVGQEVLLSFADIESAPGRGWFLFKQRPTDSGHYGTLRPQIVLQGANWAAAYHTQFHSDASRTGRRSASPVLVCDGRTRTLVSIINASRKHTRLTVGLSGNGYAQETDLELPGDGAMMLDIDRAFPAVKPEGPMIVRVASEQPTRKNLVNIHPDGTWGVDHFPNVV